MTAVTFRVRGTPAPQGSHRAFVNRRTGRAIVTDDSPATRPWRADVRAAAAEAMGDAPPMGRAVRVYLMFRFDRPRGHHGARGLLPSAPVDKVTRPDLDKLQRSTLDALTGLVFRDDALVVDLVASKRWATDAEPAGATVTVRAAGPDYREEKEGRP